MKQMDCLRCNTKMQFLSREQLQLGKTGWVLGDLPNLIAGALDVDIYICPSCSRLEFFAPSQTEAESTLPTRTCPNCGAVHDFDYPKCPRCRHPYYTK